MKAAYYKTLSGLSYLKTYEAQQANKRKQQQLTWVCNSNNIKPVVSASNCLVPTKILARAKGNKVTELTEKKSIPETKEVH